MSKEKMVNFVNIVNELIEKGLTQVAIADACDVKRQHIARIKNGEIIEPGYTLGYKLIKLHRRLNKRICKQSLTE